MSESAYFKPPCRCVNCDYTATQEDGKCDLCRERPEDPIACVFLSDDAYMESLRNLAVSGV